MNLEMKAIAQRPSEPLLLGHDVETRKGIFTVSVDASGNLVLDGGYKPAKADGIEAMADEPEAKAEIGFGVGDEEAVGERCGQGFIVRKE